MANEADTAHNVTSQLINVATLPCKMKCPSSLTQQHQKGTEFHTHTKTEICYLNCLQR